MTEALLDTLLTLSNVASQVGVLASVFVAGFAMAQADVFLWAAYTFVAMAFATMTALTRSEMEG